MGDQLSKTCADDNQLQNLQQGQQVSSSQFQILQTRKKEPQYINNFKSTCQSTDRKVTIFDHENQQNHQTLVLQVIGSATLQEGQEFVITSNGYNGSQIKSKTVNFGYKRKNVKHGYAINDIVIPCIDKQLGEKHRGHQFYIRFDESTQKFKIKDCGQGFGCFRKFDYIPIKNNQLFQIGSMFMIAYTVYGQDILRNPIFNNLYDVNKFFVSGKECSREEFLQGSRNQAFLKLNIYSGTAKDENYLFSSLNSIPISIGRSINCQINYPNDDLLSKSQCTIYFDQVWMLMDGNGVISSRNGSWVQIQQEIDIQENMEIKANYTIFKIHLKD